jgi:ribonucleoside-diphosphate reductase alpha chain
MTDDPDIRMSTSVMDYIFRRLALDFLPYDTRAELGIFTAAERAAQVREENGESSVDMAGMAASAPVEQPVEAPKPVEEQKPAAEQRVPLQVGSSTELLEAVQGKAADAPLCFTCGTKMRPAGSCYVCEGCGSTSGCS